MQPCNILYILNAKEINKSIEAGTVNADRGGDKIYYQVHLSLTYQQDTNFSTFPAQMQQTMALAQCSSPSCSSLCPSRSHKAVNSSALAYVTSAARASLQFSRTQLSTMSRQSRFTTTDISFKARHKIICQILRLNQGLAFKVYGVITNILIYTPLPHYSCSSQSIVSVFWPKDLDHQQQQVEKHRP